MQKKKNKLKKKLFCFRLTGNKTKKKRLISLDF